MKSIKLLVDSNAYDFSGKKKLFGLKQDKITFLLCKNKADELILSKK